MVHPPIDPPVDPEQHYFSLEEARAQDFDDQQFDDDELIAMRDVVEQVIEHPAGVAFIPRRRTEQSLSFNGRLRLGKQLVREVEAVTIGDDPLPPDQFVLAGGWVTGIGCHGQLVSVTYTHGFDSPPLRIKRAALLLLRTWLVEGPIDARATQMATGDGSRINLATPGLLGSITGIPEVDAAIKLYKRPPRLA